jgi:acyl-CoA thioesterase
MPNDPACSPAAPETDLSLEAARAYFANDRFASERCGAVVEEARPGHAVCSFVIEPAHRNAMGAVMGGAVFTLADFALAVASNFGQPPRVTATSNVEFVSAAKGSRLVATCDADRTGSRLGFYTTRVEDDLGRLVALVHATCMTV